MEYEKSCGAVVYTRAHGGINYVIVRSTEGYYGFPKGHVEAGESERETALREIAEEVGLKPDIVDGFRVCDEHPLPAKPGVIKQIVYFLAEYEGQALRPQMEELSGASLMGFEEALGALQFESSRAILRQANDFISRLGQ